MLRVCVIAPPGGSHIQGYGAASVEGWGRRGNLQATYASRADSHPGREGGGCSVGQENRLVARPGLWWSEDATTWNGIEAFKGFGGSNGDEADLMSLSCWTCGSGSAWEWGRVAAEGEHCEGDEGLGTVEPERDSGEQADLGICGFD